MSRLFTLQEVNDLELSAVVAERERITKAAWDWIDEYRGHDGECDCRIKAAALQQFIEHPDFTGVPWPE